MEIVEGFRGVMEPLHAEVQSKSEGPGRQAIEVTEEERMQQQVWELLVILTLQIQLGWMIVLETEVLEHRMKIQRN